MEPTCAGLGPAFAGLLQVGLGAFRAQRGVGHRSQRGGRAAEVPHEREAKVVVSREIVYFVATPTPNRTTEMDRVARAMGRDAVRLVFSRGSWESASFSSSFPEVCRYHTLDGTPAENGLPRSQLVEALEEWRPRVVIVGGYREAALQNVMHWCQRQGVPYCLRSDSNVWTDRQKGWLKFQVRRWRLTPWVRQSHRVLLGGEYNRQFWRRYGMRSEQEGWWPQWIDYDHFEQARRWRQNAREGLRAKYGFSCPIHLLYVGRLIPLKRLPMLCQAVTQLDARVGLVLVGHGPEETMLRERFGATLGPRLQMVGRVEPSDLPELYAAADALVLPTGARENWGLVLNEATAAGLPVVCHAQVGAAADLLRTGENGVAVVRDDAEGWRTALEELVQEPARLVEWGQASARLADAWRTGSEPVACLERLLASCPG